MDVRRRGGFTLIEMVTALLIVSLAVAVAVPAFLNLGNEDDLTRATRRVETLFRLARDSALHSGLPVTVVIDSVEGLVWIDTPEPPRIGSKAVRDALAYPEDAPAPGLLAAMARENGAGERLEPGQPIGLPGSVRLEVPRARALFTFEPSGAALADTLVMSGPFGRRSVVIDPWTGDVKVR